VDDALFSIARNQLNIGQEREILNLRLNFWPGLERCFAQVARVLKPGGLFLICNESDGLDTAGKKFEKIIDGMKCYTAEELEDALREAGFSEVSTDHHGRKPWICVLARK
jgi:hypothetical protein